MIIANLDHIHTCEHLNPPAIIYQLTQEELSNNTYDGSGSNTYSPFFTSQTGSIRELVPVKKPPKSLDEIIEYIRGTFGVSKEDLAEICKITRKTLYNWKNGSSEPRKPAAERLFKLYSVALDWAQSGTDQPGAFLHTSIIDDKSLFDLLSEESLDIDAIAFARTGFKLASLRNEPMPSLFTSF